MGVMNTACNLTEIKENKDVKKTDGNKCKNIKDLPKLTDANFAGTSKSHLCKIILCEGDSAKALAIAGLSVIGRDYYGVFPLRRKVLNVRDIAMKKITENHETSTKTGNSARSEIFKK